MIDFDVAPLTREAVQMKRAFSEEVVRKIARYYDAHEHEHDELTEEELRLFREHQAALDAKMASREKPSEKPVLMRAMVAEERSYGDAYVGAAANPTALGNAAIDAVATPEQKARFGKLKAAMAITEPGCGSDSAAITTTARLDPQTNEWVLNGEKIFVTSGKRCEAVVVWATLDRKKGRPAIKSFVVEKSRPGIRITKREHKLGIRASDTAAIVLEDCRIPYENILGSPEILEKREGFKGVMATFDATRPLVAASAIGIARAALELTKEKLEQEGYCFSYDRGVHSLKAVEKDVLDMEANLEVARLLTWRAASMLDDRVRNSTEASEAKAKAGRVASQVCQKCVTRLGPLGYSGEGLVEKWMRDCKITDLFEGTGQINTLIIARNILGFSRNELK